MHTKAIIQKLNCSQTQLNYVMLLLSQNNSIFEGSIY
jgi:hypothetical protein